MARPVIRAAERLTRSPALGASVAYGASGLAYAAANLLLARELAPLDYALFALLITILNVCIPLAPLGLDGVVNRHSVRVDSRLFFRVLASSVCVASLIALLSGPIYGLRPASLAALILGGMVGGIALLAAAVFQSLQRFGAALALSQSANLALLLAAGMMVLRPGHGVLFPIAAVIATYAAAAAVGWAALFRAGRTGGAALDPFMGREALSYAGVSSATLILIALERLLIPKVLTMHDLATFGVLAAIVGSAFRMLQMGVGYTLLPRLRAAASVDVRRRLLRQEGAIAVAVLGFGAVVLWFATPMVAAWAVGDKYLLSGPLIMAALVSGWLKVLAAFAKPIVTALGTARELAWLNASGWMAVAAGVLGAIVGARWGLTGVIYGVSLGWLCWAVCAIIIAAPHLRRKAGAATAVVAQAPTAGRELLGAPEGAGEPTIHTR